MNARDKQRVFQQNTLQQRAQPAPRFANKILDSTGMPLAEGDIVDVPAIAVGQGGMIRMRVAKVEMPSGLITGRPPQPPIVILVVEVPVPVVDPSGVIPSCYKVGEIPKPGEQQRVDEGTTLESEKLPEGITLPDDGKVN